MHRLVEALLQVVVTINMPPEEEDIAVYLEILLLY
jgi:hypothetical protein